MIPKLACDVYMKTVLVLVGFGLAIFITQYIIALTTAGPQLYDRSASLTKLPCRENEEPMPEVGDLNIAIDLKKPLRTPGCRCKEGYKRRESDGYCDDVDECDFRSTYECSKDADCVNTDGSYTCKCRYGFYGNGKICENIDECGVDEDLCDTKDRANCIDTHGSYECACKGGFGGNGFICNDIDSCVPGENYCDKYAKCTDAIGSYTCTCNDGLEGDGRVCRDINECMIHGGGHHVCDNVSSECVNEFATFGCKCKTGFRTYGASCRDIDECDKGVGLNRCHEHARCVNTLGSYNCSCRTGFVGDGFVCNDLNECRKLHVETKRSVCLKDVTECVNTVGSYRCECVQHELVLNAAGTGCFQVDAKVWTFNNVRGYYHVEFTTLMTRYQAVRFCEELFTSYTHLAIFNEKDLELYKKHVKTVAHFDMEIRDGKYVTHDGQLLDGYFEEPENLPRGKEGCYTVAFTQGNSSEPLIPNRIPCLLRLPPVCFFEKYRTHD